MIGSEGALQPILGDSADDGPGVAAWRRRTKSPHGKGVFKRRGLGECINTRLRQWHLYHFTVRGREKVNALLHLFALAQTTF